MKKLEELAETVRNMVASFPERHCNRQNLEQYLLDKKETREDVIACIPLAVQKGYIEIRGDELFLKA